ncbi:MAG: accessory factor UbiK family protein [Gammaproteobacteria bacterium]
MDARILEELTQRISAALPPGINQLGDDFNRALRASLDAALQHMNLVSREEFDVQQAVLERTRAQLRALEDRLTQLESKPSAKPSD